MAQFPGEIQYQDVSPSGRIAAVQAQMPATGGLEAIGRGLENLGQKFEKQKNAKRAIDFSTKKRQFEEMTNAALNINQTTGDPEARKKLQEQWAKDADAFTSDDPVIAAEITKWKNGVIPGIGQTFANHELAFGARENKAAHEVNLQHLMETGELDEASKQIHNYQATTNQISPAEAEQQIKELPNQSALVQAISLLGNGQLKQAAAKIINLKDLTYDQLKEQQRINGLINKQMEVADSESNKQLTDIMVLGKLTFVDVQARREKISDTDYQQWAKIVLNPPDKRENIIAETELKSAATDIWRGTTTKDDFDRRTRTSLADANGINDKQYARIMDTAGTELKSTQAEDIRRFSRDAANVILGQYTGLLTFDALGNLSGVNLAGLSDDKVEDVKYRMHFLSLYEQGIRDWLAANPKASGKEFYQFASEQKMRYWNTTLERMKEIAKTGGKGGTAIAPEGLIEKGNINLNNQTVHINKDGSISSVKSKSFNFDGAEVLLDMVDQNGTVLTDKKAIKQYRATGKHLGKFSSVTAADKFAEQLHQQQAVQYPAPEELRRQNTKEAYEQGKKLGYWQ